jgi:3-oxoacyl-[acyl-carrier protein] reductase
MDLELRGKVALVTGGSRGIGQAIALRLAMEGCHVGLCGRSPAALDETVATLHGHGVAAHGVVTDVTAPGAVERFVEESAAVLGGLDLLVANVGDATGGAFVHATPEDWRATFELNAFHAARAIRAAAPHMAARGGGSALTIASISGWKPGPPVQYGAAKAAEIYLAGALAWELAPQRIRVNTLSPGSIMMAGGYWDGYRAAQGARFAQFERREFPWGRLGTAEEIADVAVFVLSERARWINGAHIPVDGAQGRPIDF